MTSIDKAFRDLFRERVRARDARDLARQAATAAYFKQLNEIQYPTGLDDDAYNNTAAEEENALTAYQAEIRRIDLQGLLSLVSWARLSNGRVAVIVATLEGEGCEHCLDMTREEAEDRWNLAL